VFNRVLVTNCYVFFVGIYTLHESKPYVRVIWYCYPWRCLLILMYSTSYVHLSQTSFFSRIQSFVSVFCVNLWSLFPCRHFQIRDEMGAFFRDLLLSSLFVWSSLRSMFQFRTPNLCALIDASSCYQFGGCGNFWVGSDTSAIQYRTVYASGYMRVVFYIA